MPQFNPKVVGESRMTHIQRVGKCLNQYQVTLTFDYPVNDLPNTVLTETVRAYLGNFPSISRLTYNETDPSLVSVVYVVDSSD